MYYLIISINILLFIYIPLFLTISQPCGIAFHFIIIKLFALYNTTLFLNILSKFAEMNDFMLFFNIFQHIKTHFTKKRYNFLYLFHDYNIFALISSACFITIATASSAFLGG